MAFWIFKKDKRVGSSDYRRHYDLPLNQDEGTFFLGLLIALMTFLATIAMTFSFSVNQVMDGWSKGMEHQVTIEIPASAPDGSLREASDMVALQDALLSLLNGAPYVVKADAVEEKALSEMIAPWLGDISNFDDIPLPALVSAELKADRPDRLASLHRDVEAVSADIRIDTHESWLADLSRLTGSLQLAILFIVTVIAFTSVAAVAGGIKSQIDINKQDVELLHLMGAHDSYITKQFLRHAAVISFIGAVAGIVFALAVIFALGVVFDYQDYSILPRLHFNAMHVTLLALLPVLICFISSISARMTVLRVLSKMP